MLKGYFKLDKNQSVVSQKEKTCSVVFSNLILLLKPKYLAYTYMTTETNID